MSTDAAPSSVDCVVVGAGVEGLACARALTDAGYEVLLLEKAGAIGTETSSRNSEVIHAGIYYPRDSLKAATCVEGRAMLYEYAAARGVAHKRVGKLIVATDPGQLDKLAGMHQAGLANGVSNLQLLSREEAVALEPELCCSGALLSPSTGVISAHELMDSLWTDAEAGGATLALHCRVLRASRAGKGMEVLVQDSNTGEQSKVVTRWLVNAAGLHAQVVAAAIEGVPPSSVPPLRLAKGSYFSLAGGGVPFSRLVYPLPDDGGLGIHLTIDLGGQAKFGPDVEWLPSGTSPEGVDYRVDPARAERFYPAVRKYWPGLPDGALRPDYAGVRPKISGPGAAAADFVIQGARGGHGVPGVVSLFGIESPGLTAALSIAARVVRMLRDG